MKLYKFTLSQNHTVEDIQKYKDHCNLYNKLKQKAKEDYYQTHCKSFRDNTKKLWNLINETIKKIKHGVSIMPRITVEGVKINNPKKIANSLGHFYSTLGASLAAKIVPSTTLIENYIQRILQQLNSLALKQTNLLV